MKKLQTVFTVIIVIVFVSCRSETSYKIKANILEKDLESETLSRENEEIFDSNIPEKPDIETTEENIDEPEYVNPGDEYLKRIAEGQQNPIRILLSKDLESIDLGKIKSEARPVETRQKNKKIPDTDHAYDRILDLQTKWAFNIRCRGVFEESDNFIVLYFDESRGENNSFRSAFVVKKSDGHVSSYHVDYDKYK